MRRDRNTATIIDQGIRLCFYGGLSDAIIFLTAHRIPIVTLLRVPGSPRGHRRARRRNGVRGRTQFYT